MLSSFIASEPSPVFMDATDLHLQTVNVSWSSLSQSIYTLTIINSSNTHDQPQILKLDQPILLWIHCFWRCPTLWGLQLLCHCYLCWCHLHWNWLQCTQPNAQQNAAFSTRYWPSNLYIGKENYWNYFDYILWGTCSWRASFSGTNKMLIYALTVDIAMVDVNKLVEPIHWTWMFS